MKPVTSLFVILLGCTGMALGQTDFQQKILDKLHMVSTGQILDSEKAWLVTPEGEKVGFSKFLGDWVLIDFWSYGCAPCVKEFPKLSERATTYKDRLKVIAVSVDPKFERFSKGAKRYHIEVPHYFAGNTYANPLFNLNIKIAVDKNGRLQFRTETPQYVLIDPTGKIVDKEIAKPSSKDFTEKIAYYLNKK